MFPNKASTDKDGLIQPVDAPRRVDPFYYRALYGASPPTRGEVPHSGEPVHQPGKLSGGGTSKDMTGVAPSKACGDKTSPSAKGPSSDYIAKAVAKLELFIEKQSSSTAKIEKRLEEMNERLELVESRVSRMYNMLERRNPTFGFIQRMVMAVEAEIENEGSADVPREEKLHRFLKDIVAIRAGEPAKAKEVEHIHMLLRYLEEQHSVLSQEVERLRLGGPAPGRTFQDDIGHPGDSRMRTQDARIGSTRPKYDVCPGSPSGFPQKHPPPLEKPESPTATQDAEQRRLHRKPLLPRKPAVKILLEGEKPHFAANRGNGEGNNYSDESDDSSSESDSDDSSSSDIRQPVRRSGVRKERVDPKVGMPRQTAKKSSGMPRQTAKKSSGMPRQTAKKSSGMPQSLKKPLR